MKEYNPVAHSEIKEYEVRLEIKIFDGTVEDDMNIIHFTTGKNNLPIQEAASEMHPEWQGEGF